MGKLLSRLLRVSDVKCEEKMGKLLSRLLRVSGVKCEEKRWENFYLVC